MSPTAAEIDAILEHRIALAETKFPHLPPGHERRILAIALTQDGLALLQEKLVDKALAEIAKAEPGWIAFNAAKVGLSVEAGEKLEAQAMMAVR